MRFSEYLGFSFSNLREMKLRTALTMFGVTVGIGALVAMVGFGIGMQKNVEASFRSLDLLNNITVLPGGSLGGEPGRDPDEPRRDFRSRPSGGRILDDAAVNEIGRWPGVESVFPEIRFPAIIRLGEREEFRLVQVVPAGISASKSVRIEAGKPFSSEDEDSAIIGHALLRSMDLTTAESALGRRLRISSLAFDPSLMNPADLGAILQGKKFPFKRDDYEFTIVGVTESFGFGGPSPLASDVFIPPGSARRINKLPFTNIYDLFRAGEGALGYSAVTIRLTSPAYADPVKDRARGMGFSTFALIDQFQQIKTSFVYLDMMLAAVGMIAIFVAALGIVNTMVMSIMERYSEIGIMKAVGASNRNIMRIFFVEAGAIGFGGGVLGLGLGWAVSRIINRVVNFFLAKQGLPYIEYFHFPLWLCLGAIAFAVLVSLVSGVYPAFRAARVDPVVALRHE